MIVLPSGARVWLACGYTDMRKGMDGLAMLAQQVLQEDPFSSALLAFRGKRGFQRFGPHRQSANCRI
jgi:transposase